MTERLVWLKCNTKPLPTRRAEADLRKLTERHTGDTFELRWSHTTGAGVFFWVAVILPERVNVEFNGKRYDMTRHNGQDAPLKYAV